MRPEQRLDENFFEMFLVNSCQRLDNSQTASFLILLSAAIAMGVWKLFYDNSLGLLMRGCRRSSTETAIEANGTLSPFIQPWVEEQGSRREATCFKKATTPFFRFRTLLRENLGLLAVLLGEIDLCNGPGTIGDL